MSFNRKRVLRDYRVVVGLLGLANVIVLCGFVYEYDVLFLSLTLIGLAGCLGIISAILWAVVVVTEHLIGD